MFYCQPAYSDPWACLQGIVTATGGRKEPLSTGEPPNFHRRSIKSEAWWPNTAEWIQKRQSQARQLQVLKMRNFLQIPTPLSRNVEPPVIPLQPDEQKALARTLPNETFSPDLCLNDPQLMEKASQMFGSMNVDQQPTESDLLYFLVSRLCPLLLIGTESTHVASDSRPNAF